MHYLGLSPDSVDPEPGWRAIFDGGRIALVKVLRIAEPAAVLREKILGFLSRERTPELAGVHIVRGPADLEPMMPRFVPKFFAHEWLAAWTPAGVSTIFGASMLLHLEDG